LFRSHLDEAKDPGRGGGVDTKAIESRIIETQAVEEESEPGDPGGIDTMS
jgi:hypothetical protein